MTRRLRLRSRLLAAAGLVLVLAGMFFAVHGAGLRLLWFTSGSMSPTIAAGSLALAHAVPDEAIRVGDILSVVVDDERVTHRVVATDTSETGVELVLRGDANAAVDPVPYVVTAADVVLFAVPPLVLLVAGALMALIAWAALRRRRPRPRWLARIAGAAAAALAASLLVAVPTTAFWTDQVTATSSSFSTGTVPAPGPIACATSGSGVRLSWTNPGARFDYRATLHRNDTDAQVGAAVTLVAGAEATISRELAPGSFGSAATLSATGQTAFVIRIVARPAGSTTWTSAASPAEVNYQASYTTLRCGLVADTSTTVDITSIASDSGASATDYITNVATQTVRGTGGAGATVVLTRNGTSLGTATVAANGTWSIAGVTLSEGAFPFVATATDPAGNTATDTQSIRLDTIAPSVMQEAASCGTTGNQVAGQPTGTIWCLVTSRNWTMTATDTGGSGVVTREFTNAGSAWIAYTTTVAMAEMNGRVMQARATDVAGNTSTVATGTYWIDGTAPTVGETYPTNGLSVAGSLLVQLVGTNCGTGSIGCGTITDAVSGLAGTTSTYTLRRSALTGQTCFTGTGYTSGTTCASLQVAISSGQWRALGTASAAYPLGLLQTFTLVLTYSDAAGNTGTRTVTWTALA
jgi:signal peptidase I